jgi:peptidoglycan-associated lipoprotein
MQLKKSFAWLGLSAFMVIVSACSSTGNNPPVDNLNGVGEGVGTKVSGVSEQPGFGDGDQKFGQASSGLHGSNLTVGEQTYYFDFNESAVHDADKPSVQVQANYLIKHPEAKLLLEGYTDPRGSREYNVALGERRADAVLAVLKADGAAANQIRTVSFGAEKRASSGETEADYAQDRRVHLLYVEK